MHFNTNNWMLICGVLIPTVYISLVASTCPLNFSDKCTCARQVYDRDLKYVVNCTNTHFTNATILTYMPAQTEVLIFVGNNIPVLPWNVFGAFNDYTYLTIVDMSNNHIREIRGKTYHHVKNVERLILNHNNISISSEDDEFSHRHPRVFSNFINLRELHLTNAFADYSSEALSEDLHEIFINSSLTKITKLHLEQNEIVKFKDRNVFCALPSLKDLHLGDNYLKEINFNLMCLRNLRFLDLERNKFEYVKQKDLNFMNNLEQSAGRPTNLTVDFTYNPLQCDCNIFPLMEFMRTSNVTVRNKENLKCGKNELVLTLKVKKCRLQAYSRTSTAHTVTLVFLFALFSCVTIGLISALIYISRHRIKRFVHPIFNTVSKKVHYTTIKDDECQEIHV